MNYASEKEDWKKFEKSNLTIGLNVLHAKKGKNISSLGKFFWKTNKLKLKNKAS